MSCTVPPSPSHKQIDGSPWNILTKGNADSPLSGQQSPRSTASRDMESKALVPSIDNTVALGSASVTAWSFDKAYWNGDQPDNGGWDTSLRQLFSCQEHQMSIRMIVKQNPDVLVGHPRCRSTLDRKSSRRDPPPTGILGNSSQTNL